MSAPESRYDRHHLIDWWNQERLQKARVLVAGAGAIGNEVIKNLALMGVGNIWIIDFDQIDITNLTRSVLFRESDIGRNKAHVAAERAQEINPDVHAHALPHDLEYEIGDGVFRAMDLVIGCLDSVEARLALNRACLRANTPWLNGGIETTLAEVSLFRPNQGACYECGMSSDMWEQRHQRFSCGGLRAQAPPDRVPTTAVVASLVASYLVNEALYLLHETPQSPKQGLGASQKLIAHLKPYRFDIYSLPHNTECLAHEVWEPVLMLPERPADLTVALLLERVEAPLGTLELGFDLVTGLKCVLCGAEERIFAPLEKCPECLRYCAACQANTRQPETVCWLDSQSPFAGESLQTLCIPEHAVLQIKKAGESLFFQLAGGQI